jgi:hypothetical protein
VKHNATTRTVELRHKADIAEEKPLWQMKKFQRTKPKVSTFRSEVTRATSLQEQREQAMLSLGRNHRQGIRRNPAGHSRNL